MGPDRVAVVIGDGQYGEPHIEERVETRKRFRNVAGAREVEVLSADLTPFTVTYELDDTSNATRIPEAVSFGMPVLTNDQKLVTGHIRLTLSVSRERPDLLYQLRRERQAVTNRDVAVAIGDEFLAQVVRTNIVQIDADNLQGTADQFTALYRDTQTQLASQLSNYGLTLLNFAPNLLPVAAITRAEGEEFDRRRRRAEAEREIGSITGARAPTKPESPGGSTTRKSSGNNRNKWLIIGGIVISVIVIAVSLGDESDGHNSDPPLNNSNIDEAISVARATVTPPVIASRIMTPPVLPLSLSPTPSTSKTATSLPTSISGTLQLEWRDESGELINESPQGSITRLHALLPGTPDSQIAVELFEVDQGALDQLVATISMRVVDGVGTANWEAVWMSDGLFNLEGNPEYKFIIGGVESGELTVIPEPDPLLLKLSALPPGTIVTIAGTGEAGFSGDGGAASDARLSFPQGLAIDSQGNIYIADTLNSRVRRVDASTGVITTVASESGYANGEVIDWETPLHSPYGVAVDAVGNLYISEPSDQRVRLVDGSTGMISTLIDTSRISDLGSAQPRDVATDCQGNVYVGVGDVILRVNPVIKTTTVVAGIVGQGSGLSEDGGQATTTPLGGPRGIVVDCEGTLFFNSDVRVFEVDASSHVLVSLAGIAGINRFGGDGGPATSASLSNPSGVAIDGAGNVFIAVSGRIRRIDATTGVITTVAGTGDAAHCCPTKLAMDANGNLFVATPHVNRILVVTAVGEAAR